METLIIHPETPERAKMLKAVIKALNFTYEKSTYKPEFVDMVKKADKDFKQGNGKKIKLDDIWK